MTLKVRTSLSPLSSTGAGLSGPHLLPHKVYREIRQCGERGDPGAGDRAQAITRTRQTRCRDILGRTVALGPVWEGGGKAAGTGSQPGVLVTHSRKGGSDKRVDLSGSWNTGRG